MNEVAENLRSFIAVRDYIQIVVFQSYSNVV